MAKVNTSGKNHTAVVKRTSQGGTKVKTSSMTKTQKTAFKKYRGQGR
jgi:formylmethanofuran dehydrogenase subunit E